MSRINKYARPRARATSSARNDRFKPPRLAGGMADLGRIVAVTAYSLECPLCRIGIAKPSCPESTPFRTLSKLAQPERVLQVTGYLLTNCQPSAKTKPREKLAFRAVALIIPAVAGTHPNPPILPSAAITTPDCSLPVCGTVSPVRSMIWAQWAAIPSGVRSSGGRAMPGVRVT